LLKSWALAFAIVFLLDTFTEPHVIPYAALFSGAPLVLLAQCAIKLEPRWRDVVRVAFSRGRSGETVVIVGAGHTGQLLAADLLHDWSSDYQVLRFVDDDERKWGTYIRGVRVEGGIHALHEIIPHFGISLVVIAMSKPSPALVRTVVAECDGADVRIRVSAGSSIDPSDTRGLRPLSINELLGREPVDLNTPEARQFLRGRRVLITGAAGSIGSELARQVIAFEPARLVLLDISESGLHDLREALGRSAVDIVLGDIRDETRMHRLFEAERPGVVFHAAAYKHVPILEDAPAQAIATNVSGTANLLAAAAATNVDRFVFISTDKAVVPTSVLGVTKRFGELLTIAYAESYRRPYCVVRFGNVLGSIGSVVPIFERQIDAGGPVTVTHPDATRFFMTIAEAAGLVIEAGAIARVGDLLVLDMGTAITIEDLARKMIRLRGLRVPQDIAIVHSGLRPGEKLHEELFFPHEAPRGAEHPRVQRADSRAARPQLTELRAAAAAIARHLRAGDDDVATAAVRQVIESGQLAQLSVLEKRASE
jgi:FlaA1/EpsC-like NDP-sugar epimerase